MDEKIIDMNFCVGPLEPVENIRDIERMLLQDLEKKQQGRNEKWTEKIEEHIEKDKTIRNRLEEEEAAQQINETQEAIFLKNVLPSQALQKDDLKNNIDDRLFTSGISKKDISEQKYIEKASSPTKVRKEMKDFVVVVKQMVDNERKDFSKDTTEFSDGDCINEINFKIPSQVFKEGPITNHEVDKNIEKHIQFIAIEADKNIRKVIKTEFIDPFNKFSRGKTEDDILETDFPWPNDNSWKYEKEDEILETEFSGPNGKSSMDEKEDKTLETEFSGRNGKSSKDEKEDEILETESSGPNDKSLKDEKEDEILETEFSGSSGKFSKDEKEDEIPETEFSGPNGKSSKDKKEDEILETESSKNDQKFLKEEKENKMLKLEFLKDDRSSSKKGKNDKMLKVESLKDDQEFSKKGKEDKILKIESLKDDQGSPKKRKKGKTLKAESLKNDHKLSKGKKGDKTLKVKSSKNDQKISKEEKMDVILKTKFVRNDREPLKGEKEDKTLKAKSRKKDQEIPERGKDDKTLEIESLSDDQKSSKEKHPKVFEDVKLEIPTSVENAIEEMELWKLLVETQETEHSKDQKSSERDYPKNVKDTELEIPKDFRFKDQVLNMDIKKYIRDMACEIKTSIDETLKMKSSKFYEKTVKDEKKDEKVKAESLKSDQGSSKRGEEEGTIKTKSLEDQESSKRNDQNLKNVKLEIHSNTESTKNSIEEISLASDCKNFIELIEEINEMRNVEDMEDNKKTLKEDHSKDVNNTLKIPSESSKEHAIKDRRLDENRFNKLPQTGDLKDNQESLNEDHPKNINDTKSSNLEQIPTESPAKNFAKNKKKSAEAKNMSQKTLETDGKTSETQETADSKDSNDASNMNVPSTSSLVSLKSNLDERPFVLATYLVPSLPIELFELLAEIVEEVIKRPVVLIYESRKNQLPCKEIVDMAILPADTEWKDGILLNASFIFNHCLNSNNLPFVYADVIIPANLPPYIKDIIHLRGHGCIVPNKRSKLSAAGLLYDFLRMKGENTSFFGHTTIASSQLAVLEAVARQHTKLGVIDSPVMHCHKFNCCDVEPIYILHSLGPLPPYRIMLNKYVQDYGIMEPLMTYLLNIHKNKEWMTKLSAYGINGFAENSVDYYSLNDMEPVTMNVPYY